MKHALRLTRDLALLGWDVALYLNDRATCAAIGCDWKWQDTTNGPLCACARSGCTPPIAPRGS